jgi:sugar lactone lactonase YvrE
VVGDGSTGYAGDGGPATTALVGTVGDVVTLANGDVLFSDTDNDVIRRVSVSTGVITTFAGDGTSGFSGDGGPASAARLSSPRGLAVDGADNVFVADTQSGRIRRVSAATGVITSIAGTGSFNHSGDGGPAVSADLLFVTGLAVDQAGNVLVVENGTRIAGCRRPPASSTPSPVPV